MFRLGFPIAQQAFKTAQKYENQHTTRMAIVFFEKINVGKRSRYLLKKQLCPRYNVNIFLDLLLITLSFSFLCQSKCRAGKAREVFNNC